MDYFEKLAKSYEVIVVADNTTYQYTADRFIKEYTRNEKGTDGIIVERFYYKGERITNYKTFPGTFGTDEETMYDVVVWLLKRKYIKKNVKNVGKHDRNPIPKIDQLDGQMDLFDFV